MKKFSNISGTKVSEEPKVEVKNINEEDLFKMKVLNLMEQLLSIRTYGPVDRYLRAGNIKIAGKEMFLEALMDVLKSKSLKDETKILESLKSSVKDWEAIDNRIEETNKKISESKSKDIISRNKIRSLFSMYGNDEDMLMSIVKESCRKIKKSETASRRSTSAESMIIEGKYPKNLLRKISNEFSQRAKQLNEDALKQQWMSEPCTECDCESCEKCTCEECNCNLCEEVRIHRGLTK